MKLRDPIRDLAVRWLSLRQLRANPNNARTHSKAQIRKIASSIEAFGWVNPLIVDSENRILCGHGRFEAARLLGHSKVPTILIDDLSDKQKRAYALADNRLAELAGWDRQLVALELKGLMDLSFDVGVIGFDTPDIDRMLSDQDERGDPADELPEIPQRHDAATRPGDLWLLGSHRILCGDATMATDWKRLMDGEKAAVAITDPPYNVRVRDVSGLGRVQHREFAMASGEMTAAQYVAFLDTVMGQLVKNSASGSIHYLFIDWRHVCELLTAGRARYDELKNICIWVKANAGMGSFYRSQHELIAVFKHGSDAHTNNIELGQHGRNRSNVWHYAGVNGFRAGRMDDLAAHPTVKPVAMLVDAIKDCSRRGGLIVDCFAGSGTTVIAAERTGRRAFAMEIDPLYVDVAVRRWQKWTGRDAVLASSNATFDEVAAARAGNTEAPRARATKSRIGV